MTLTQTKQKKDDYVAMTMFEELEWVNKYREKMKALCQGILPTTVRIYDHNAKIVQTATLGKFKDRYIVDLSNRSFKSMSLETVYNSLVLGEV